MTAPHPHRTLLRRAGVATLGLPLALLVAAAPATGAVHAASDGDVVVTNTETVQARLDANGRLQVARVYEQLAFAGKGTATVSNPVSTKGLRNLDGFGGFTLKDGAMQATVTVDGEKRLRTVSDFTGDLPVSVAVEYRLDGEKVTPGAVVGRSGTLEVRYTVTNLTTRQDEVTYDDGTGKQVTATAETVIPVVGQLTTTLPSSFTAVTSDEANMAGDGRGGTKMSYTMTLFPPIGSPTAEFGYTAQITRGEIPPANVSVLPVSPLTSPSFKGGSASYAGGAASGVALTAGATEIDANLLKLRDGAATLLDGLLQLQAGADKLSAGLNDTAAPGAAKLAAGLRTADSGAGALVAGADQLSSGAGQLANGARSLAGGSKTLAEGLASAGSKAPALLTGLADVTTGLQSVEDGLVLMYGKVDAASLPLGVGVDKLQTGVDRLIAGTDQVTASVSGVAGMFTALATTGVTVDATAAPGIGTLTVLNRFFTDASTKVAEPTAGALRALAADYDPSTRAGQSAVPLDKAFTGIASVLSTGVVGGLSGIRCGLTGASGCPDADGDGAPDGLAPGLLTLEGGIDLLVGSVLNGIGQDTHTAKDKTLRGGINSLQAGADQLSAGGSTLAGGLAALSTGAAQIAGGSSELAAGSSALRSGVGTLTAGAGQLKAGTGQLSVGANQLSAGLRTAADGSQTLADGLGTAAGGAPALVDGAEQLSEQGTSVLVETGASTAADYGVKYAVIEAGAARAADESMAYGGPEGAASVTAYSIDIAGADGAGASSLGRGTAAIALFGLGGALAAFARRRLA